MEPLVDTTDLSYWVEIVTHLQECGKKALALVATRELDGDPNHGITELGFKLTLLACLSNIPLFSDISVVSEKEVGGGRIDLFLTRGSSSLVVELKYERIGFVEGTKCYSNTSYKQKHALWKNANDKLIGADVETIIKTKVRKYYVTSVGGKDNMVPISNICKDASTQVDQYCKSLREGGTSIPIPEEHSLFGVVILGVGTSIIVYDCKKYHSNVKSSQKI